MRMWPQFSVGKFQFHTASLSPRGPKFGRAAGIRRVLKVKACCESGAPVDLSTWAHGRRTFSGDLKVCGIDCRPGILKQLCKPVLSI